MQVLLDYQDTKEEHLQKVGYLEGYRTNLVDGM